MNRLFYDRVVPFLISMVGFLILGATLGAAFKLFRLLAGV